MDDYVSCPYNPQHRMPKLRLQHHIVKCRRNFDTSGMKPCPYNATHIIPKDDYRRHLQTCPDSTLIEGPKYNDPREVHGKLNEGAYHFDIKNDEHWEVPMPDNSGDVDTATDTSSRTSESNSSRDYGYCLDILSDYDEAEEPLQRFLFEEEKSQRLSNETSSRSPMNGEETGSTTETSPKKAGLENEVLTEERLLNQYGAGRGRLLSILLSRNRSK